MADFTLTNIHAIDRAVSKLFEAAMPQQTRDYERVAMVDKSNARTTDYAWLGDVPTMAEWTTSRQLARLKDYKYEIAKKDFESSFTIKRDDIIFDQLGSVKTKVQALASAVVQHQNKLVFGLIPINGNSYDNVKFFGNHRILSNNVSNKTTEKLTTDELFKAYAAMQAFKSNTGAELPITPNLLVVAPNLLQTARQILISDVNASSSNVAKGLVEYMVSPYLADDQWCLLDTTKPVKPFVLNIVKINAPTRSDQDLFKTKRIHYGVDGMYNAGYGLWQLAYFSDGTAV